LLTYLFLISLRQRFHESLIGLVVCAQDAFIGFGGNQVRERVKKEAKWFVMDFSELIEAL